MEKDSYSVRDTKISYRNETEKNQKNWIHHDFHHFGTLHRVLNMLRDEGFAIEPDEDVDKLIRRDYYVGRRNELELTARRYPAGFEIHFFQNINFENQYGGKFDFDEFQKMPYMTQLRYKKYMQKIIAFLNRIELLEDKTNYRHKMAEEQIKSEYVRSCHKPQTDMNFNLLDVDGQTVESYNGSDRDGKQIKNGEIKYFRGRDGRICRGRVYHNLNMMWFVILNKYEYKSVASHNLFDLSPDDFISRQKIPNIPKDYAERRKHIKETKTKELINELKRRGIRVNTAN